MNMTPDFKTSERIVSNVLPHKQTVLLWGKSYKTFLSVIYEFS
jgi:hypothetical protein